MNKKWIINYNSQSKTVKVIECEGNTVELDKQDREVIKGLFDFIPGDTIVISEKDLKELRNGIQS